MIPANHRSMARTASKAQICVAALYSVPGMCRCPKCNPDPAGNSSLPAAAAVRVIAPPAAGGGNSRLTPGDATGAASPALAADRTFPLSGNPIGGLSHDISGGLCPAPETPAADRHPSLSDAPVGGPSKRTS